ncbi:uncharacterized protein LOC121371720 [Gigantopelta aegis]|uniref:uncharacterized protein LOC121371720 n=1 Tax=Gigantopelta aegis TaxID=1735272 RepID=UPI001B889744|nr:uncharacterized protein LOC121371720 [Gigantopelta aegis]
MSAEDTTVTDEQKQFSFEEKLEYIDREIRKLHVFCVNAGYSPGQIDKLAAVFHKNEKVKKEKWNRRFLWIAVFVAVTATLFYVDPVYRIMSSVTRKTAISILPVWDWTRLWNQNCLIDNPLYTANQLTTDDCQICEGLHEIKRLRNISAEEIVHKYLRRDIPVIVEDGTRDWPHEDLYSITALEEAFNTHPVLRQYASCSFTSNIRVKYGNHRHLIQLAANNEIKEYFAHWENCFAEAGKAFRTFYKRPYFFPRTVELAMSNWLLLSSNYTGRMAKKIQIGQPMMALAQVSGKVEVFVQPLEPCERICSKLAMVLRAGEILVTTDFLWSLNYLPIGANYSVTIGIGGSFD